MSRESIKEAGGTPAAEQKTEWRSSTQVWPEFKKKKKNKKPLAYPRIRLEAPIYSNGYLSARLRAPHPHRLKATCCGAEKLEGWTNRAGPEARPSSEATDKRTKPSPRDRGGTAPTLERGEGALFEDSPQLPPARGRSLATSERWRHAAGRLQLPWWYLGFPLERFSHTPIPGPEALGQSPNLGREPKQPLDFSSANLFSCLQPASTATSGREEDPPHLLAVNGAPSMQDYDSRGVSTTLNSISQRPRQHWRDLLRAGSSNSTRE